MEDEQNARMDLLLDQDSQLLEAGRWLPVLTLN